MNGSLERASKFKYISLIILSVYLILTIILTLTASYLFSDYWLLFGIIFSYLGNAFYHTKFIRLFYILTIPMIMYWFDNGFHLYHKLTFFWISFLFGNFFKLFIDVFESIAESIIDAEVADFNSYIKGQVRKNHKQNDKQND